MRLARHPALPVAAAVVAAAGTFAILAPDEAPAPAPAPPPATAGQLRAGEAVFARMGCGGCHALSAAGATAPIGPDLDQRLPGYDRGALIRKIVAPYAGDRSEEAGFMPKDFGLRMSGAELDALVAYLLASTRRAP